MKDKIGFFIASILIVVSATNSIFAQGESKVPTQTLRGQIIDNESNAGIPGSTVVVLGTDPLKGAVSDEEGYFRIENLPVGRYTLQISSIGYDDRLIPELLIGSGKEVILNLALTESLIQMDEIVIKSDLIKGGPQNELAFISARSFSVEETKRYAASINDPARMALSFAGVSGNSDDSNEIIVRGNSPRGVLWKVEGVEIPSPNHFTEEGASGGGVSILSTNLLSNSDFFTGAFPAEYGNAFSGVFDIKLRNGNNEKREYAVQVGVLGVDFAAEGPFGKNSKASYLINYRYSSLGLLSNAGLINFGDYLTTFQDLSFKVKVPTEKFGTFSIWSLSGKSISKFDAIRDSLEWEYKADRFDENFYSDMTANGITHVYYLNDQTYMESSLSFSGTSVGYNVDSLDTRYERHFKYEDSFANTALRFSTLYNKKINAKSTLRVGLIAGRLGFNLDSKGENEEGTAIEQYLGNKGNSYLIQAYAQYKYRFNEKLSFTGGMHSMYLVLNGSKTLEPRAGIKWDFKPGQSISGGFGLHSRVEAMSIYFAQDELGAGRVAVPNKQLDFMKAYHYVLAYDRQLTNDLNLKIETYYQDLQEVPIAAAGTTDPELLSFSALNYTGGFTTDSLVNDGTGKNYGVELTLEKFFTRNYYFMLTTSIYESKYTARDCKERDTYFSGNYVANLVAGKEYKVGKDDKNLLSFNLRAVFAGGKRDTPIDLQASRQKGEAVYNFAERYTLQNEDYFRIDTRIAFTINKRRTSSVFSLDIQNVTNRQNIFSKYYDEDKQAIDNYYQLGLLPVLNYRLEF